MDLEKSPDKDELIRSESEVEIQNREFNI